jgi:hypothetical protein
MFMLMASTVDHAVSIGCSLVFAYILTSTDTRLQDNFAFVPGFNVDQKED